MPVSWWVPRIPFLPAAHRPGRVGRGRLLCLACCLALAAVLLGACSWPGNAAPIVKIGLVAPFEGLERPLGYAILPAVNLAIADANASGELGPYRVALVALNDDGDPATAGAQVLALAQDTRVMGALGPWDARTAAAAIGVYREVSVPGLIGAPLAGLPPHVRSLCPGTDVVAGALIERAARLGAGPPAVAGPDNELGRALQASPDWRPVSGTPDARLYTGGAEAAADDLAQWRALGWGGAVLGGPDVARAWLIGRAGAAAEGVQAAACALPRELPADFAARYQSSAGTAPAPEAALAYAGTRALLRALSEDIRANRRPSRAGTGAGLAGQTLNPALQWLRVQGGRWAVSE